MNNRKASVVVALLAATGLLTVGCGGSSSNKAAKSASPTMSSSAAAATPSPASIAALPPADCAIIKPIGTQAISTLGPLQSKPKAAAAAGMKKYLTKLHTAESHLTSPKAKADLNALISALQNSAKDPAAAATLVPAAIGKLSTDCP
jgi:hypothetical protein